MSPHPTPAVVAKKSYRDGCVEVSVKFRAGGWGSDRAQIAASTELTTTQARELAAALIARADEADEKIAQKQAAEDRRRKWREREIAAGRLIVFGGRESSATGNDRGTGTYD